MTAGPPPLSQGPPRVEGPPAAPPLTGRTLLTRLDELEREYRRLRRFTLSLLVGTAVLLGLAVALVMMSSKYGLPGTVADVVAARQFVLRGPEGLIRGVWGTENDGTLRLVLQDRGGRPRVKLNLLNDGSSGLTFSDSAGRPRAAFALLPDQSSSIVLADEGGRTRTVLGISARGGATLVFADRAGATRAGLGVDANGSGTFMLTDRTGRALQPAGDEPDAVGPDSGETPESLPPVTPGPARR